MTSDHLLFVPSVNAQVLQAQKEEGKRVLGSWESGGPKVKEKQRIESLAWGQRHSSPTKQPCPGPALGTVALSFRTADRFSELLMPLSSGSQTHPPVRAGFTFGEITCEDHLIHLPFIWGFPSPGDTFSALLPFILFTRAFRFFLGKFSFFLYLNLLGSPNPSSITLCWLE